MNINLTDLANAIIAVVTALISTIIIPWIQAKTSKTEFEKIKLYVTVAVQAAEQIYSGNGRGAEKKAFVINYLKNQGFNIDAETLDKLIEAGVFNLPEYFNKASIEKIERR